jgi:hypothetical protein
LIFSVAPWWKCFHEPENTNEKATRQKVAFSFKGE